MEQLNWTTNDLLRFEEAGGVLTNGNSDVELSSCSSS